MIHQGFDVAWGKPDPANTVHAFSHWPDNGAQKFHLDSAGHLCMNANTEMVLCIDPKDKNESLKIINKVPSKVKDEHKHLEPMRFNAIKPMTPGKSEIRKLTLSSHPGKAIIKKENDS